MTPETLRLITDAMATAGAAIGGKGSVGELVGQTVLSTNIANRAAAGKEKALLAEQARQGVAGKEYLSALSSVTGQATASDLAKPGEEGYDLVGGMKEFSNYITPPGTEGITSVAAGGQPGEFKINLNMPDGTLGPGDLQKAITQGLAIRSAPTGKELGARELSAVSAADLGAVKQLSGGEIVTAGQAGQASLAEQATPTAVKAFEAFKSMTPEDQQLFEQYRQSGAASINIGQVAAKKAAVDQVALETSSRKPAFVTNIKKEVASSDAGIMASSLMLSEDPAEVAEGKAMMSEGINDLLNEQLTSIYGTVGVKEYDGVNWFVAKTKDGKIKKLQKVR